MRYTIIPICLLFGLRCGLGRLPFVSKSEACCLHVWISKTPTLDIHYLCRVVCRLVVRLTHPWGHTRRPMRDLHSLRVGESLSLNDLMGRSLTAASTPSYFVHVFCTGYGTCGFTDGLHRHLRPSQKSQTPRGPSGGGLAYRKPCQNQ